MREARRRAVAARSWESPALAFGGLAWQARQQLAERIASMAWDDYDTLTLVLGQRESAGYLMRCHRRWSLKLRRYVGRELRQVVAIEWQKRGTAHAHVLSQGNDGAVSPDERALLWQGAGGGWAACRRFRSKGGAAEYCTKYVVKDCDLALVGPWPALDGSGQLELLGSS